jgi:glycosyltransferase involved in cell wall biosynthesis
MHAQVTVVIPAWDAYAGEGLAAAVASVRSQATRAEVIVVDNASQVPLPALGSVEVVRVDRRCSRGAARNAGLGRIRTPYVVFLDADDALLPGALPALVDGIDGHAGRAACVLSIIEAETGRRHRSPRRVARVLARVPALFSLANAVWSLLPTQGATIMRVSDVRACGGYGDSDHGEDWVLAASLAFRGRVLFDRRPALCYRRRADSPGTRALGGWVLLNNARCVRARLRADPAVPGWARSALPLLAAAQWAAARVAHPVYRDLRSWAAGAVPVSVTSRAPFDAATPRRRRWMRPRGPRRSPSS